MTARYEDDRLLRSWLQDVAPAREPEHLLGEVLARTARTRRRPAWRNPERWNPMSAITSRLSPATPVPWRLLGVAAALLLALVVGLVLVAAGAFKSTAPPYGLAANGGIFYSVGGDIVVSEDPTAVPATLLGGAQDDRLPLLSFDGSAMAFLRGPEDAVELWVASTDGSNARRIAGPWPTFPDWAEWSPSGDALLVIPPDAKAGTFDLTRTDGSGSTTVDTGLRAIEAPIFRPVAGKQISFRGKTGPYLWGYYLINRDGTGLVHLDLDPGFTDDPFYSDNASYYFLDLTWASDGTRIAYHTLEPDDASPAGPGFRIHVADMDPAGVVANERVLEFEATSDDEFAPLFIPGTSDIVFQAVEGSSHSLFRGSTEPGRKATPLGITARGWLRVTLAPDGRSLIVAIPDGPAATDPAKRVVLLDLATLSTTPLTLPEDFSWQRRAPSGP